MKIENLVAQFYAEQHQNALYHALELLNGKEGQSAEEGKQQFEQYVRQKIKRLEKLLDASQDDAAKTVYQEMLPAFWSEGEISMHFRDMVLRQEKDEDRESFLKLQKENLTAFHRESERDIWKEHRGDKIAGTIEERTTGEYVGYCALRSVNTSGWEIEVGILRQWTGQKIGFHAVTAFLDAVSKRLQINCFRVRIAGDNYASQALFEKIGAVPNGLSLFQLCQMCSEEEIQEFENRYKDQLDDSLLRVAEKFQVPPEKLLSHALEYKLQWPAKCSEVGGSAI